MGSVQRHKFLASIRGGTKVTTRTSKKASCSPEIEPCLIFTVGGPELKVFPIKGLQYRLNFHICAHFLYHLCGYVSYVIVAHGRQISFMAGHDVVNVKGGTPTHLELTLVMFHPYHRHRVSLKAPLLSEK